MQSVKARRSPAGQAAEVIRDRLVQPDHDAVIEALRPPVGQPYDYAPVVSADFIKTRLDAITRPGQ